MKVKLLKKLRRRYLNQYVIIMDSTGYEVWKNTSSRNVFIAHYVSRHAAIRDVRMLVQEDIMNYISEHKKIKYLW